MLRGGGGGGKLSMTAEKNRSKHYSAIYDDEESIQ
jgi:hypothetical protein